MKVAILSAKKYDREFLGARQFAIQRKRCPHSAI
jgi:hypothetical protein